MLREYDLSFMHLSLVHLLVWMLFVNAAAAQPASLGSDARARPLSNPLLPVSTLPKSPLVAASASDARLNCIAVINEDRICVVGDRGVVLTTENAGLTWETSQTETTINLHSVAFSGEVGFAVGGWIGKSTGMSYGAILKSHDGGKTWVALPSEKLARLTGIGFLGDRIVAWGDYSPELKASVIESSDGGTTWRGFVKGIGHASAVGLATNGAWGAFDVLGNALFQEQENVQAAALPQAPIYDLEHIDRSWLACGGSGELITSVDGAVWTNMDLPLSSSARRLMDYRAIDSSGSNVWICGAPGSVVLHSSNGGKAWRLLPTGQSLPMSDIRFVDKNRGWMVGAQGLILATRDGGNTWYPQRQLAQRVAVLSVVDEQSSVPWSLLAAAVWDQHFAVASLVTGPNEPLDRADFKPDDATKLSTIAPQIGISQHDSWLVEDATVEQATQRLAISLLSWRPDVVVTQEKSLGQLEFAGGQAISVSQALKVAANARQQLPEANELYLPDWQVAKLVSVTDGLASQYSEQSSRVLGNTGLSLWDILLPLPPEVQHRVRSVSMRTVWAQSQAKVVQASMLGGVTRDKSNAHELKTGQFGSYQLVMGRIHRNRSLEQLVEIPESSISDEQWRHDLQFVLSTLPASEFVPAIILQTQRAIEDQSFTRQRILLETLASFSPLADAAASARYELLRLASSDEFSAWQRIQKSKSVEDEPSIPFDDGATAAALSQAVWNASPFDPQTSDPIEQQAIPEESAVVAATAVEQLVHSKHLAIGQQPWFQTLDQMAQASPVLLLRPDMQLLIARNMLHSNNAIGHIQQLDAVLEQSWMVGWHQAARQEMLLATDEFDRLKWLAFAPQAATPPLLDGELNESFWLEVPPMELSRLKDDSPEDRTKISWAYDAQYLYIAIDCPRIATRTAADLVSKRTYDAELSNLDHVQIRIDTDRDYNSAIELGIAENGQTYDRCCGYAAFNPKWHVMVKPDTASWRAEVAIERSALTMAPALEGGAWAVSARRLQPGCEPESWSQLKTHQPLDFGSGLLLFAPGDVK